MDFHNLIAPAYGPHGMWVVLAKNDMFLILLRTGELGYGPDYKPVEYHFDSESEAHIAAAYYYNQNRGRTYPYIDRMLYVTNGVGNVKEKDIQSQSMDFK